MKTIATIMMWWYGSAVIIMLMTVAAEPRLQQQEDSVRRVVISVLEKCGIKHISLCMKERALNYLNQLPTEYDFGSGLKIKQNNKIGESSTRTARFYSLAALPKESIARENSLDNILLDRVLNYATSYTFEFKMPEDSILEIKRSLQDTEEEARKKKKKGFSIMTLLQMKAALIGALALKAIGMIAFKAFVMAKLALAIASIIALKKLFEQKHTSTYEVVAHPYEDHHYDRSFDTDLSIVGVGAGVTNGARSVDSSLPYRGY